MQKLCENCRHRKVKASGEPCKTCIDTADSTGKEFSKWEGIGGNKPMEMVEYQELSKRTINNNTTIEMALANFGMGLAGEAGETVDYLKKVVFHGHDLDKQKLCDELGDVLWYVASIATTAGLSLEDVAWENVNKLKKRYPEGFDKEKSVNRKD